MLNSNNITNVSWGAYVDLLPSHGVVLTHKSPDAASVRTSFVAVVKSVCGATIIVSILWSILGFIVKTTTGRVRLLNIFCSNFPLLVS